MKTITSLNVKKMILNSNGMIFTVEFIKKNGEYRKMNCRTGVSKNLKGGVSPLAKCNDPFLITVFDMQKQCYRTLNLKTAQQMQFAGESYKIVL